VKTFSSGLRTEILLSLTLLLVAAMALTGFIVVRVMERDLLRYKAADGMAVVERLQAAVEDMTSQKPSAPVELLKDRLRQGVAWLAPSGLFGEIIVVGKDGLLWVGKEDPAGSSMLDDAEIASALQKGKLTTRLIRDQGVLSITSPLFRGGQLIGAVQVPVRIDEVVQGLRRSQLLIWLYIGLNALLLLVLGNFLLSRIVIRPIKRLVNIADHFEETDVFSIASGTDRTEIAHLSVALNRMLKRLSENREHMAAQIRSLQRANRELKQAREEVFRSEKLSSIGRLAAGVAHEVGNPIGAILGYTGLLTTYVENSEEARDYLTRIEKEITRIDTIVRELLDFSRPSASESSAIDVNFLVTDTVSFFSHQKLMASVELETLLDENAGMVWADPDQLKQVLINLMFNACDAMEDGGRLTIATRQTSSPEEATTASDEHEPEVIEICVSDTGKGIAASELTKIFDPFYTTKPPGKGTGLGLAISLRIVESLGGSMHVDSTEGEGSTFTITLAPWHPKRDG
jgi:hypothetical protein